MRKILLVGFVLLMSSMFLFAGGNQEKTSPAEKDGASSTAKMASAEKEVTNISFAGSTPGGAMYYLVGVAGTVISEGLDNININQVSTGGSTENTKRLLKGEVDMGVVYGPHVYLALNQQEPFAADPKGTMLRGVAKLYEGSTYFVTLPGSGIKTMADLKGKTVAMGPPGSGTVFNSTNVLKALNLYDDIDPRMMSFADAGRAVANRQIDAFAQSSAPAGAVTELAETNGAFVIPYSDDEVDQIVTKFPFYYSAMMPEGTYKGVPPTQSIYLTVFWVAHESVSEDAIYDILKYCYQPDVRKKLEEGYKTWAQFGPGVAGYRVLGSPMHPGAEKFYKEAGLWEE
jgi:TRAP transporter TAXI family solute receptor